MKVRGSGILADEGDMVLRNVHPATQYNIPECRKPLTLLI